VQQDMAYCQKKRDQVSRNKALKPEDPWPYNKESWTWDILSQGPRSIEV